MAWKYLKKKIHKQKKDDVKNYVYFPGQIIIIFFK